MATRDGRNEGLKTVNAKDKLLATNEMHCFVACLVCTWQRKVRWR
jgi:hypothetical protein